MKYVLLLLLAGCAAENGTPGKNCTLTSVSNGVMIGCPDGSSGLVTNGSSGVSGTNGSNGVNGSNGAAGVAGTNGSMGVAGVKGERGTMGLTGLQGPQGVRGLTGLTGPAGPQGIQGPKGLGCGVVIIDHYYYLKCDDGNFIKLKKAPHGY